MLVAFAALAEQAAARSFPVRFLALSILRHAEAVAWGFVADATGMTRPVPREVPAAGNGPSDALMLAARLRAMAAWLAALLRPGRPRAGAPVSAARSVRPHFIPALPAGCWTRKPNDTS